MTFENVDACAVYNGKAYFFSGEQYLRFDIGQDKVDQDPRLTREWWPGWPESWWSGSIQAALPLNQFIYFFRGAEYIRFDMNENRVTPGYPKPIAGYWPGWPASWNDGVDGCVRWVDNKAYFFKGGNYIRYDLSLDKVTKEPTAITTNWGGWPASWGTHCNGGGVWPTGKAYLFNGTGYLRYDIAGDTVDSGYPKVTKDNWVGWPGYEAPNPIVAGGTYTFKSKKYNTYLTREGGHYVGNRSTAGADERFTLIASGTHPEKFHLKDNAGSYAKLVFTQLFFANVPGIQPHSDPKHSRFDIVPWDGAYALKFFTRETSGEDTPYYISIQSSGAVEMRTSVKDWELFIVTRV